MKAYFEKRLKELREKYRDTGEIEFLYRHRELLRAYEVWQVMETEK